MSHTTNVCWFAHNNRVDNGSLPLISTVKQRWDSDSQQAVSRFHSYKLSSLFLDFLCDLFRKTCDVFAVLCDPSYIAFRLSLHLSVCSVTVLVVVF